MYQISQKMDNAIHQFPDGKKIPDFYRTFPDKFAAKKLNKCSKFINTDFNLLIFSIHGTLSISKMFTIRYVTRI